jgi:hypothetical protein
MKSIHDLDYSNVQKKLCEYEKPKSMSDNATDKEISDLLTKLILKEEFGIEDTPVKPKQKIKVKFLLEKTIDKCYHTCPYFDLEGMEHCMICTHPYFKDKEAYANCIISHPDCDDGFPKDCPLLKEQNVKIGEDNAK